MLVYDLLDYGLDDDEERALPQKFEHLIDCMTSEDDAVCTSDIGSDCDSDSDQILGIIRSSTKLISLQEIIQASKYLITKLDPFPVLEFIVCSLIISKYSQ